MKAPKAPDPYETAAAQGKLNKETAISQYGLNATDQYTPYGSLNYTQQGKWADGTPHFKATQTLSPDQQHLLDNQEQLGINLTQLGVDQSQRLSGLLNQPFKLPGGAMPTLKLGNEATESRLMELGRKRLDPALDRRRGSAEQDLFNRGARPGTEAYARAMEGVTQGENDAYNQLLLMGRGQAASEGTAEYNAAMQGRNQLNTEYTTNREMPINEILALASGGQVQQPNFVNTPGTQLAAPDLQGLIQKQYESKLQSYQSGMSGLFGLGSALIGAIPFSDERLKEDIKKVGETDGGTNIYQYRMKGSPMMQLGVMAQEVPEARIVDPDTGFYRVDYAKVA